ncbi:DUF6894 family protein [Microvirga guangxiensis]|uniref:DUF6894 domain-containing protein n=1 Tax=Microvirga guangxiensis TaxID=549386 RepID=A0A1G5LLC3_9HYPH|nr:hypothetical protein [Microvirga guangxiensis]SCZ13444.1 hypothetical protein SAMN02927923_04447 [Microvirga guangxiensis]
MPRYYFNVHINHDVIRDPEGQNLSDPDQAWEVAKAMAVNLMETKFEMPINWATGQIEVRDDVDEVLLELPFMEAIKIDQQSH